MDIQTEETYHVHTHATPRVRTQKHAYTRTSAHVHASTHARMHAHPCTHARTHMHARTHARSLTHARMHALARLHQHAPFLTHHGTPSHAMVNPHTWHTLTCHHTPAAIDVWLKPTLRPETPACHAFVHTCMRCGAMWCCAEPGSAVQYHARRCSAVRCGTIRRATARRGAVEYRESSEWKWLVSGDTITPVYTCAKLVE